MSPTQLLLTKPGTPASDTVGTAGRMRERFAAVMASGSTLPLFSPLMAVGIAVMMTSTEPPISAVIASLMPL